MLKNICWIFISSLLLNTALLAREPDVVFNNHNAFNVINKDPDVTFNNRNELNITNNDYIAPRANQPQHAQSHPPTQGNVIPNVMATPSRVESLHVDLCGHQSLSFLETIMQPKVVIGAIGIVYAALMAKLLYASYVILSDDNRWASWKQEIPNSLLTKADAAIAKSLYDDIQAHYANQKDTALFLTPILCFVNDVDSQMHELELFIKLHETLTRYKVAVLFPAQEDALKQAAKKIQRLQLLKPFMIKSIREYKVSA
jgi:hypothetical protein